MIIAHLTIFIKLSFKPAALQWHIQKLKSKWSSHTRVYVYSLRLRNKYEPEICNCECSWWLAGERNEILNLCDVFGWLGTSNIKMRKGLMQFEGLKQKIHLIPVISMGYRNSFHIAIVTKSQALQSQQHKWWKQGTVHPMQPGIDDAWKPPKIIQNTSLVHCYLDYISYDR